jgi:integrase
VALERQEAREMTKQTQRKRGEARRAKLTKRTVDSLEIPGAEEKYGLMTWDTELKGFAVRVMPSGVKSYYLDYFDKHHRQHRLKIARHGVLTADEARREAKRLLALVSSGSDPIEEREEARGAATFRLLAEEYIRYRCGEKKSGYEDARIIRRELLPHWGRKLAGDIRRRDVMNLTDDIKERGSGIMANRTRSLISRLFNFGIDRELVEGNPALRVKPPAKEKSRERVLENEEIKTLWKNLDRLPGDSGTRLALQLLLVTAQRPGEIASLSWEEIDAESVWTIPAEKSKNGRAHRVPLSPLALELLGSLPHGEEGPVFPSPVNPRKPITRAALAHMLYRGRRFLKMDPFTPHDLRRTAASKMAAMGVSRLTIGKVLNHADRGATSVYDRHGYDEEKRAALLAWSEKLRDIIEGRKGKVLPLAR